MAELLTILDAEFDHTSTTEEVLREVANKRFQQSSVGDAKGPKSFSRFLVKLAELSPRLVQKQISLLLAHLDSEVSRQAKSFSGDFEADLTGEVVCMDRNTRCGWPSSRLSGSSSKTFR